MVVKRLLPTRKILTHILTSHEKIKKFTLSFLLIIATLIAISGVVLHQKTYQASSEAQTAAKTAESTKDYLFFQSSGTASFLPRRSRRGNSLRKFGKKLSARRF